MMRALGLLLLLLGLAGSAVARPADAAQPVVLAAASLRDALTSVGAAWAAMGHPVPRIWFAASSAGARQVLSGAPADIFVSADEEWMDAVQRGGRVVAGTRTDIARNRLVVVAPAGTKVVLARATLAAALSRGPLAMADPDAVPAGRYGRAALMYMGAWKAAAPHVVRAENVRAALALVERGGAPFGIVYATDARVSRKVRVAGLFPEASHSPIRYPVARLRMGRAQVEAEGFRRFLLGPQGHAILARFGFRKP